MRTILLIAAAATAVMAALLALVEANLGGTPGGDVLVRILVGLGLGPFGLLVWAGCYGIKFAHARDRTALRLSQEIGRCGRGGDRIVLALLRLPKPKLCDLPLFRSHRSVLDGLRSCFRGYDQVERVGFSTYTMILPGTDEVGATSIRERLLEVLRREHRWNVRVGTSIHPEDGLTAEVLLDHADRHCA